jgi:hypothetical protein
LRTSPCLSPRACLSPHTCLSLLPFCTAKVPMGLNTKNCNERHATCKKKIGYIMVTTKFIPLHTGYNQKIPFQIEFVFQVEISLQLKLSF